VNTNFSALDSRISALEALSHPASAFSAALTAPATAVPNNVVTPVLFDTVDFDLAGEYTAATGVFAPKNSGTYAVSCSLEYISSAAITQADWSITLLKNGLIVGGADLVMGVNLANGNSLVYSRMMQLAKGDTLTCAALHLAGGTISLALNAGNHRCAFSAARLY
jgi:hypothetical protein